MLNRDSFGWCQCTGWLRSNALTHVTTTNTKNERGDFSCETSPLCSDFRRSGSASGSQLGSPRITRHSRTLARVFLALLRSLLPQELSRRHPFPVAWPESRCRFPKMTVCPLSPLEDRSSLESDTTPDRPVCKWSLMIFCCGNEVTDGGNSPLWLTRARACTSKC